MVWTNQKSWIWHHYRICFGFLLPREIRINSLMSCLRHRNRAVPLLVRRCQEVFRWMIPCWLQTFIHYYLFGPRILRCGNCHRVMPLLHRLLVVRKHLPFTRKHFPIRRSSNARNSCPAENNANNDIITEASLQRDRWGRSRRAHRCVRPLGRVCRRVRRWCCCCSCCCYMYV